MTPKDRQEEHLLAILTSLVAINVRIDNLLPSGWNSPMAISLYKIIEDLEKLRCRFQKHLVKIEEDPDELWNDLRHDIRGTVMTLRGVHEEFVRHAADDWSR